MVDKPKATTSLAEKELDKAQKQFETFDNQVKEMTLDRMNMAPKQEVEPQTKMSSQEISKSRDVYLKPHRTIGCRDKFNEDYRKDFEFAKEYVQFTAENKEIIGEEIDMWTRPFAGMPAEWWKIPVNRPVWAPRYVAEQIKKCSYHRLIMREAPTHSEGGGVFYGQMAADTTIQRLDAIPVNQRKSVFMGASGF